MRRQTSPWAVFSLVMFLSVSVLAQTTDQGKPQSSSTQQPAIVSISFSDVNHGWAAGLNGTILATTDGGASWKPQTTDEDAKPQSNGTPRQPPRQQFMSVDFIDAAHGWLAAPGGTLVTSDGGANWKEQPFRSLTIPLCVQFLDGSRGWMAGTNGTILATTDGGASWSLQFIHASISQLTSVHFVDPSRGWAVGTDGTILATTDGGASWSPQSSGTTVALLDVYFLSASNGWAVGQNGTILATTDGGISWKPQFSGIPTQLVLHSVYFIDANHGWVVGMGGMILETSDGGISWKHQSSGTNGNLYTVQFVDANHGWTASPSPWAPGIWATTDGGATWKPQLVAGSNNAPKN